MASPTLISVALIVSGGVTEARRRPGRDAAAAFHDAGVDAVVDGVEFACCRLTL